MFTKSTALVTGLLSLAVTSLAKPAADPVPGFTSTSKECQMTPDYGPTLLCATVKVPSTPPRTEFICWQYGENWCTYANKISDTPDICNPSTNRAAEFKTVPFSDRYGVVDFSCYANFNVYFSGCENNADGTVNYDNLRANFVSQSQGSQFPGTHVDYDCTYVTENRACPYDAGYGTQTEWEALLECGAKGGS
ncbi:Hypothetical predicted protein [Lecanosticta acicola]|uniref:Major allergen alt a1 n=1 Tax=Lecanosticta acicola TaxID=111012 RepID=A0AAI8YW29_9PEZI|nr:Hypothetical predicted protein [Lecanosticta acicola]